MFLHPISNMKWPHQKIKYFLKFPGGIETHHWTGIDKIIGT